MRVSHGAWLEGARASAGACRTIALRRTYQVIHARSTARAGASLVCNTPSDGEASGRRCADVALTADAEQARCTATEQHDVAEAVKAAEERELAAVSLGAGAGAVRRQCRPSSTSARSASARSLASAPARTCARTSRHLSTTGTGATLGRARTARPQWRPGQP